MKVALRLTLVVIALTALLAPLLSATLGVLVRDVVVIEILRLAWMVDRLVDSLPQEPFWIAFLFVAAMAAAVSLLPRTKKPDLPWQSASRAEGQVADLALLIRRASARGARAGRRDYFRRRLVQRLSYLGREMFAHRAEPEPGSGPGLAERGVPWVRGSPSHVELLPGDASLQQALAQLRAEPDAAREAVDPAVEFFVRFLEEQLEVDDGPFHRAGRRSRP